MVESGDVTRGKRPCGNPRKNRESRIWSHAGKCSVMDSHSHTRRSAPRSTLNTFTETPRRPTRAHALRRRDAVFRSPTSARPRCGYYTQCRLELGGKLPSVSCSWRQRKLQNYRWESTVMDEEIFVKKIIKNSRNHANFS